MDFLFFKPGILKTLLVINKFVTDKVELIPVNIIDTIATSWDPNPVKVVLEEKGVINVQPAIVYEELEHLTKKGVFFSKK